jgi:Cu(I)/Ag(I) efflux system protein CusF
MSLLRISAGLIAGLFSLSALAAADGLTDAVVKKIDPSGTQVTLTHGPIENLGMMGMTMPFRVKEPGLLKDAKPGDKLRVRIEDVDGKLTVVKVVPAN